MPSPRVSPRKNKVSSPRKGKQVSPPAPNRTRALVEGFQNDSPNNSFAWERSLRSMEADALPFVNSSFGDASKGSKEEAPTKNNKGRIDPKETSTLRSRSAPAKQSHVVPLTRTPSDVLIKRSTISSRSESAVSALLSWLQANKLGQIFESLIKNNITSMHELKIVTAVNLMRIIPHPREFTRLQQAIQRERWFLCPGTKKKNTVPIGSDVSSPQSHSPVPRKQPEQQKSEPQKPETKLKQNGSKAPRGHVTHGSTQELSKAAMRLKTSMDLIKKAINMPQPSVPLLSSLHDGQAHKVMMAHMNKRRYFESSKLAEKNKEKAMDMEDRQNNSAAESPLSLRDRSISIEIRRSSLDRLPEANPQNSPKVLCEIPQKLRSSKVQDVQKTKTVLSDEALYNDFRKKLAEQLLPYESFHSFEPKEIEEALNALGYNFFERKRLTAAIVKERDALRKPCV